MAVVTYDIHKNLDLIPVDTKEQFIGTVFSPKEAKLSKDELDQKFSELRGEKNVKPIIYIGAGTCGMAAGAGKALEKITAYLADKNLDADVVRVGCIGLCTSEPMVDVKLPGKSRLSFQQITEDKVDDLMGDIFSSQVSVNKLLGQFQSANEEENWDNLPYMHEHPFFKIQERVVLKNCGISDPVNVDEYIARGGYSGLLKVINNMTREELCNEVEKSGLRGRGGGGFPTGRKWKFALGEESEQKYFICNADEGDPGAFMDRAVIEGDPHKLVEGLAIAAYAIGANKAYVYIRAEYPLAIANLKDAIAQAKEYKLIGNNIYNSGFDLDVIIKVGAGAFVCGEETALIHSIEGKRGMPRPRPPFPAKSGLFQNPTIINNVETLANIPSIVTNGAEWYASMGSETSKGTKVFAVSGKVKRAGLVEIPMGTSLRTVIFDVAGGIEHDKAFKAVQFGGPSGGCIPTQHLDINIDYESLIEVGAMIGSGGMVVMDEDTCMVDVAKFFMGFIQRESCGKCIPCREGTRVMLEILEGMTKGRGADAENQSLERFKGVMNLERLTEVISASSLCGLGQTAPNPIKSAMKYFRDEFEAHIYERRCPAGACTELLTFEIIDDACTGCTICAKKCPTQCIDGEKKGIHIINQEDCISCGACMDVCAFDAIKAY